MRLVSWNVNGLRAVVKKGFMDAFNELDADVFAIQETKLQEGQIEMDLPGYHEYWSYAERKGYSGTAVFCKEEPLQVLHEVGVPELDTEGRCITLEYPGFYLVNCYTPNSQNELVRLPYREQWDAAFREYVAGLAETKPVVFCGDLNVAHEEIDIARPKENRFSAGFSDQERAGFTLLLEAGFTDTFRALHPEEPGWYSWWSYRAGARARNIGWRIDYFCVSNPLASRVKDAAIHPDVTGSDHCPVSLEIDC